MNIKVKKLPLDKVLEKGKPKKFTPKKPNFLFRTLLKILSSKDLKATNFKCEKIDMDKLGKKEPCLILMNHSSFIDLKIAQSIFYPRPMNIVTTLDGMVGMEWLMKNLGCIPTRKFVNDTKLVRTISTCLKRKNTSVLMYPEASYSFDGTATPLPESLGKLVKLLAVPVITVITQGAFHRQPLYNDLKRRKVNVSATVKYLLSPDDCRNKSAAEINAMLDHEFAFDAFRWQKKNKIEITEPDRADRLDRVLYKCPNCYAEGNTEGRGTTLTCHHCEKTYELTPLGTMQANDGKTEIEHIPDWYAWQRAQVKKEILDGNYKLEDDVKIYVLTDTKALYDVGEGHLVHDKEGFVLTTPDGELLHSQKPIASYSLYADYFWYELGDVICIGDNDVTYCCIPKNLKNVVAKARLATEELYKLAKNPQ